MHTRQVTIKIKQEVTKQENIWQGGGDLAGNREHRRGRITETQLKQISGGGGDFSSCSNRSTL